jgi:hypothetical protein
MYNQFLTTSSLNNLHDVQKVMSMPISDKLYNMINLDNFYENSRVKDTFNRFLKKSKSSSIKLIGKIDKPFNPAVKNSIFNMDGLHSKGTYINKEYNKLNKETVYTVQVSDFDLFFKLHFYYAATNLNINKFINNTINRFNTIIGYNIDEQRVKFLERIQKGVENCFSIHFVVYNLNRSSPKGPKEPNGPKEFTELANQGCYNTSSGYTALYITHNNRQNVMLVSRIPEAMGLFTHELGHLLGIDFETPIITDKRSTISGMVSPFSVTSTHLTKLKKLPIKLDVNMTEAICNTNTTFIHTICNALEVDKSDDSYETFKNMFKVEILYAIYHSAKILHQSGYNSFDDFFNCRSSIKYKQKAYLFEYTVVRSFMLLLYPQLCELMTFSGYIKFKLAEDKIYDSEMQPIDATDKWIKFIDITLNLMTDKTDKTDKLRNIYRQIFDSFIEIIKSTTINKNTFIESSCGDINMEYFCIDLDYVKMNGNMVGGGSINYYKKYIKYKQKYAQLKNYSTQHTI